MKSLSSIFSLLIIIIFFYFSIINFSNALLLNLSDIDAHITPESNREKVKKLQTFFKNLWLYNWEIDWKYENVKSNIIAYQIKTWIIQNENDWWAWYFWKKTVKALAEDFQDDFIRYKDIIKKEETNFWYKTFIVTAYYSPLPNQKRYITWSYSWDKIRNWEWKITASWKGVFPWLLAAPRNYDFWTKIYFDSIWVWIVEDRWSAIVNSGERWYKHDRIDIWTWYWDEWLQRAINWWKRQVKWKIVPNDVAVNIELSDNIIPKSFSVTPNSSSSDVEKLQILFKNLWLYNWEIDWKYENIKNYLINYQVSNWIISSKDNDNAGYFWPKTIASLRRKYNTFDIFVEKYLEVNDLFLLSSKEKKKIENIRKQIIAYIDKKSNSDSLKRKKYLNNLKNKLDVYIKTTKNIKKKRQLKYLQFLI